MVVVMVSLMMTIKSKTEGFTGNENGEQNYTVANNDGSLSSRIRRKPQGKSLGLKLEIGTESLLLNCEGGC